MTTLRQFLMKQTLILIQEFWETILSLFWIGCNALVWNMNKSFTSFISCELLMFIENTKKIVHFLQDRLVDTNTLKALCDTLLIWETITQFLVKTMINDKQNTRRKCQILQIM